MPFSLNIDYQIFARFHPFDDVFRIGFIAFHLLFADVGNKWGKDISITRLGVCYTKFVFSREKSTVLFFLCAVCFGRFCSHGSANPFGIGKYLFFIYEIEHKNSPRKRKKPWNIKAFCGDIFFIALLWLGRSFIDGKAVKVSNRRQLSRLFLPRVCGRFSREHPIIRELSPFAHGARKKAYRLVCLFRGWGEVLLTAKPSKRRIADNSRAYFFPAFADVSRANTR